MSFIPVILLTRTYIPSGSILYNVTPIKRKQLSGGLRTLRGFTYTNLTYEDCGRITDILYHDQYVVVETLNFRLEAEGADSENVLAMLARENQCLLHCTSHKGESFYTTVDPKQLHWILTFLKRPPHARNPNIDQRWQFKDSPWNKQSQ